MSKNKVMEILIGMSSFSNSGRKCTLHKKHWINTAILNIHSFFLQILQFLCVSFQSEYAVQQRLRGIMIWSVETDDFLGNCHGVRYPLLTEIRRVLCGDVIVSTIKNKIQQQYPYNPCCTSTNETSPTNEHNSSSSNAS